MDKVLTGWLGRLGLCGQKSIRVKRNRLTEDTCSCIQTPEPPLPVDKLSQPTGYLPKEIKGEPR